MFLLYSPSTNIYNIMPGEILSFRVGGIGLGTLCVIIQTDNLIETRDGFIIGPIVIFKQI